MIAAAIQVVRNEQGPWSLMLKRHDALGRTNDLSFILSTRLDNFPYLVRLNIGQLCDKRIVAEGLVSLWPNLECILLLSHRVSSSSMVGLLCFMLQYVSRVSGQKPPVSGLAEIGEYSFFNFALGRGRD